MNLVKLFVLAVILTTIFSSCCCPRRRCCDWESPERNPVTYNKVYYDTYYGSNTNF
ncbi:MAG: hypothetical protein P4L16_06690 [Chlamydiales bacterium]|nr:hypothetical protein [Chlamydiales bacterium]